MNDLGVVEHDVSVVLCTRNGSRTLVAALGCLAAAAGATSISVRAFVVDNGSTDATAEILAAFTHPALPLTILNEPLPGVARGKNRALRHATGRVIAFIDDDVMVPVNWISAIAGPILDDTADLVAGAITLSPELILPWMSQVHQELLAATPAGLGDPPRAVIGASMALRAGLLDAGPVFDEELGPGALGFLEESFLGWRLVDAGARIVFVSDAPVTHRPLASRINRAGFLSRAAAQGASEAYLARHWEHRSLSGRNYARWLRKELIASALAVINALEPEGEASLRAVRATQERQFFRTLFRLRTVPPKYPRRSF